MASPMKLSVGLFLLFLSCAFVQNARSENTCKVDFVFHSLTGDYFGNQPLGDIHYRLLNSTDCSDYKDCAEKLQEAIFENESRGENYYYFPRDFQDKSRDELKTMSSHIAAVAVDAARHLINRGATRVVIPGIFPLGCLPRYKTVFEDDPSSSARYDMATAYDGYNCLKHINSFAKYHNEKLQQGIYNLAQEKPDAIVVYADYYKAFHFLMRFATSHGMETQKACCGIGGKYNFDIHRVCGGADYVPICSDPDRYINYSGFRLTEVAYNIMARRLHHNIFPKLQCGF